MKLRRFIILGLLITACNPNEEAESLSPSQIISEIEVLIDQESVGPVTNPMEIVAMDEGFAVFDASDFQIYIFSEAGDLLTSFGGQGNGPDEFQNISSMKFINDNLVVIDPTRLLVHTYDLEGNKISTSSLEANLYVAQSQPLSQTTVVSPTNGQENSLARIRDTSSEESILFGEPIVPAGMPADFAQWQEDISNGRFPDFFRNQLLISAGPEHVYLFLTSEGILQQFSLNGDLNWEKTFDLPEFEAEYNHFVEENSDFDGGNMYSLAYITDIDQNDQGVYMLLRLPDSCPPTVLYVDHAGENQRLFRYDEMEYQPVGFSISPDGESVYLLNRSQGIVYRSPGLN